MIGILLDERTFNGIRRGRTRHEAVLLYEHAAQRMNSQICYFRLKDVSVKDMKVRALIPNLSDQLPRYRSAYLPLPTVIHNRAIQLRRNAKLKLAKLHRRGIYIYNLQTRYGKWFIHRLLMQNEQLRKHLPDTVRATPRSIRAMMGRYDALIIKPSNGSVGRGIMKLQRQDGRWQLRLRGKSGRWRSILFQSVLPTVLRRAIKRKTYIVQQLIPLATYMNRPFDLRVSVQRGGNGIWEVTGIVGKAAPSNLFLTNVAQGGTVYRLEHLLRSNPELHPPIVRMHVERLALMIATQLGTELPNLADLGLDIGITQDGWPMFIECNGRDLRYSFQEGGLHEEWRAVYDRPIRYGRGVWLNRQERVSNVE